MAASISCRCRLSSLRRSASGSAVCAVGGREQLESQRGVLETAGGVEPRRQTVADLAGGHLVGDYAADLDQRRQTRARRTAQPPEAHGDQGAVLVLQRHEVGHRAHGDDVDQGTQGERQLHAILSAGPAPARERA